MAPYALLQIHNSMFKVVNMADMAFNFSIMKPTHLALFCAYLVQTALVLRPRRKVFYLTFLSLPSLRLHSGP